MNQRQQYLQIKVSNASQEDLLIMLYDGLIQYIEEAIESLHGPVDKFRVANRIAWSIDILTELNRTLRQEANPELCTELKRLYLFFTRELSAALDELNSTRLEAILPLIQDLREAWDTAKRSLHRVRGNEAWT